MAAIDKGVVLLLTNPAERDLLRKDSSFVPRAVEEILRTPLTLSAAEHAVAAGGLPRYANTDVQLGDARIAAE